MLIKNTNRVIIFDISAAVGAVGPGRKGTNVRSMRMLMSFQYIRVKIFFHDNGKDVHDIYIMMQCLSVCNEK